MLILGIPILAGAILLGILSRKETIPEGCEASTVTAPFFKMAVYLLRLPEKTKEQGGWALSFREKIISKNEERIRLLEPSKDVRGMAQRHVVRKLGLCLLFLTVGTAFTMLIGYREKRESVLGADASLQRKEYGKGHYSVMLSAGVDGEEFEHVKVDIAPREYTKDEIREMLPEFHAALEKAFLGENESVDLVCLPADPVSEVKGYPFSVEWSFSDRSVIRTDGRLKEGLPEEGTPVTADAKISYGDFSEIYSFPFMVYPPQLSGRDRLYASLQEKMEQADADTKTEREYRLPTGVDGIRVVWTEEKQDHTGILMLLVLVMVGVIWWGKDRDLDKRLAQKDAQMLEDYPEIAGKLSLYVGAGMTLRLAWKKIAEEGKGKGRFAYEEMQLAVYEMESGTGELSAYQHFAKRSRVQRYVKLVSLLEQSVKLGARGFLEALRRESEDALEEKKNAVKRKGEEAGTRLLVPMILMLAIVMVVIIVPAFMGI